MIDIVKLSIKNILRKKLRTFLTMLGIIVGVASVTIVLAIGDGGKKAISDEFSHFGFEGLCVKAVSNNIESTSKLDDKTNELIKRNIGNISETMPVTYNYGHIYFKNNKLQSVIFGIGENAKQAIAQETIYGNNFNLSDVKKADKICIVDTKTAEELFGTQNAIGRKIRVNIEGKEEELTVKGVTDSEQSLVSSLAISYIPTFVYIPYTTVQELLGKDTFDQLIVNVDKDTDMDTVASNIKVVLSKYKRDITYEVDNMLKQKEGLENIFSIVTVIISAIAAISVIVGGLGIMSIMLAAVSERTREIGIKKAIGATKRNIISEFIFESVIISAIGGIIGLLISFVVVFFGSQILGFSTQISIKSAVLSLLFSLIIGIIFSVYPAKRAAELNPIDALRYE